MSSPDRFILRVSCMDAVGIVADLAGFLAQRQLFIVETQNFGDPKTGRFFLRVVFEPRAAGFAASAFRDEFSAVAEKRGMEWELRDARAKPNVLILASKQDHCLNDLLYRHRIGALPMNVPAVISNHTSSAWLAERHGIPFHHVQVTAETKAASEARILELAQETEADLVVLARYMQVLSDTTCRKLAGKCINIHHSFLPGFKGAAPYTQAFDRGVKLIGATAHYVTPELDEGPIITQAVERADHSHDPETLTAIGRDVEARVLSQAVKLHIEGRIFLNGSKTVVFG
ncbi:MAG TPA: formyltetrahydrofolate deformylase [Hyphomonadaceae bacterium]|jgi:formyltetrahydrofolate deformylase|nr:formyltetrahydrofolate deformylase [Hyphomonadaceae bacterium]